MAGIHLHPHDVIDEGMDNILQRIGLVKNIDHLFVEVNTIFERNPYPVGVLPHNPVRDHVMGNGTLHVKLAPLKSRLQQKIDSSIISGADPLKTIGIATKNTPYKVIPWINILNGDFMGDIENNQVVDYQGRVIPYWLCPNGPDVADYWQQIFSDINKTYGFDTFLIDRIRFPDWAGKEVNPAGLSTCFCKHCQEKMRAQHIDPDGVRKILNLVSQALKEGDFELAVSTFSKNPVITEWVTFRQKSVTQLVKNILEKVKESAGNINLWLDLWPPAYSWILGQDYHELTRYSSTLKHFPYHKLGGGADVQGLINYYAKDEKSQEKAFHAFKQLFKLPYDLNYSTFKEQGFPIEFVKHQNNLVRKLSQPETYIYSGIQMWNLPPEQLIEAVDAAERSDCNDLLYYCYGWAEHSLFEAIAKYSHNKEM